MAMSKRGMRFKSTSTKNEARRKNKSDSVKQDFLGKNCKDRITKIKRCKVFEIVLLFMNMKLVEKQFQHVKNRILIVINMSGPITLPK
jgi:hypothetical protein